MGMKMLDKIIEKLGLLSSLGYIFFSVVPYAIAGKHICTVLMLASFATLLLRKQIREFSINWLSLSLYLVLGSALLSAILSPYAGDSLNQLRKDGVPFLLCFLLLINVRELDRTQVAVYVMLSLMLGYITKEVLAVWAGATNGFQFSLYESPDSTLPKYLDFFSADTPYYLPFMLSPLCFWPMKLWQRIVLLILTVLAIAVVLVSGVRAAFILILATVFLVLVYRFWNAKPKLFAAIVFLALCGYLFKGQLTNPSISRYATIVSMQTYNFGKDGSVSERYAITKGVWEVSRDRLLLGYGPGWKKLPRVAEANGHTERWRKSEEPIDKVTLNYFSNGEGRVNPHNFYMATLFEGGLIGLAAYMSLLLAAAIGCLKMLVDNTNSFQKGTAVAGLLYLCVFFVGSFAGGAWLPVSMLVTVVCLALYQRQTKIG